MPTAWYHAPENSPEPLDAQAFVRILAEAERASAERAWEPALRAWERVISANPVEGRFWFRLGEAAANAGSVPRAIDAYERALELHHAFPFDTAYALAVVHAKVGDTAATMTALERAFALGFRENNRARDDQAFAALRDDPRFRALLGVIDRDSVSRDDGWSGDLRFFSKEVKRRAYAPFAHMSEADFDAAIEGLAERITSCSDLQILLQLQQLLVHLHDGHAGIWRQDIYQNAVPLAFYLFDEGVFITAADPRYRDLLGARIEAVNGRPIRDVLAALDPLICRDNEWWPKRVGPDLLRQSQILHALDLIDAPDRMTLDVQTLTGEHRTVEVAATPGPSPELLRRAWPRPEGWDWLPDTLGTPLPAYLRNITASFWFEVRPQDRLVYAQINRIRDEPRETLNEFSHRIIDAAEAMPSGRLVIDLRWNGGGNTFLEMPLLYRLISSGQLNQRGNLFVIIGRGTFSAAQNLSTFIERHVDAIFVGEPTGSSPTFVGETIPFTLPYSRAEVNVSDLLWQTGWAMDYRPWIAPVIYAPPTFAAFRENRDPALDAILGITDQLPAFPSIRTED